MTLPVKKPRLPAGSLPFAGTFILYYNVGMFEELLHFIRSYMAAGSPCLFHQYTGLYCPGCGGTRAIYYLFHGQFLLSFIYHPLVPYCAGLLIYLGLRHIIHAIGLSGQKKETASSPSPGMGHISYLRSWMIWFMLVIVIANSLIKNIALICFHINLLP